MSLSQQLWWPCLITKFGHIFNTYWDPDLFDNDSLPPTSGSGLTISPRTLYQDLGLSLCRSRTSGHWKNPTTCGPPMVTWFPITIMDWFSSFPFAIFLPPCSRFNQVLLSMQLVVTSAAYTKASPKPFYSQYEIYFAPKNGFLHFTWLVFYTFLALSLTTRCLCTTNMRWPISPPSVLR